MAEAENNIKDIKAWFNQGQERPIGNAEMMDFWKSLSDDEKAELKAMSLS